MDELTFIGDLHLGANRIQHTTPTSRDRWQAELFKRAEHLAFSYDNAGCLGDVFDTYSNREKIILEGVNVLSHLDWCLSGNHDIKNDAKSKGSLQLIKELGDNDCLIFQPLRYDHCAIYVAEYDDVTIVGIPHLASQQLFEHALTNAYKQFKGKPNCLLTLHCNYDTRFEKTETTLNLTAQRARELLQVFDYIINGHEHTPATHLDNRLILAGNIFPTSFADLSDKYIWHYRDGEWFRRRVWKQDDHVLALEAGGLPEQLPANTQFVEIAGSQDRTVVADTLALMSQWWRESNQLLAVRLNVEKSYKLEQFKSMDNPDFSLSNAIAKWLEDAGLRELWDSLCQELENARD